MIEGLPTTRPAFTRKIVIGAGTNATEMYATVGFYADGRPGELFVTVGKEGGTLGALLDWVAQTISIALQAGVLWERLVEKSLHHQFDPADDTYPSIRHAVMAEADAIVAAVRKGELVLPVVDVKEQT
jgi:ribonucleoside-diphosphate reductase alpha chain